MLMLGHAEMQAFRRDTRYRMFHVEHLQIGKPVANILQKKFSLLNLFVFIIIMVST